MKAFFHSRTKWVFAAAPIFAGLLIGGYAAIMSEHSRQTLPQNNSVAAVAFTAPQPSDPDAGFEEDGDPSRRRDFLDRFSGVGPEGVSPEDFARARALARALPPSPLLQGRKFNPAQATGGETPSPSWISPIQPPIVPPAPWNNDSNSSRIDAFGLHPSDTSIIYAGGSGGLLKSTDSGNHWEFLSDNWDSQAVTSIALDPSAPEQVYVGTGSFAYGVGLYRSTDAGLNWILLLGDCPTCPANAPPVFVQTAIRKVAVDSGSSGTTVYVVTGPASTHNSELWRSTDSGASWSQVPHPGSPGEIRDLAIDYLTSPSLLYIAADNGVFKSTDGGQSWTNLNWTSGSVSVSVVQSVPYLLAPNAGANKLYYYAVGTWTEIRTICPAGVEPAICSSQGAPISPWDFAVDPSNPNIILIGTNGFFRTTNATAGANATWQDIRGQVNFRDLHFDQRAIAFSEATPGLAYVGNDGGIWKSSVDGALNTWDNLNQNLPGSLLYSVGLSQDGSMMAGTQDNGAIFSNAGAPWGIVLGGDAYQALINPTNSEFSYYISNSGSFRRYIKSTGADSDIRPPDRPCWGWSMNPLAPERLTANCMPVARTNNATVTPVVWQSIGSAAPSPGAAVTGAREAPSDSNVIYAVENQSKVWVTANANAGSPPGAGASWAARYTPGGINNVVVDPTNPNVAYLACNNAVHKTTDMGLTWTIHGIPNLIYRDLVVDPSHPNQIITATNAGVFASIDGGETWGYMSDGIPAGMMVTSLSFNNAARQVAASTYGRGAYILNVGNVLILTTPTPSPTPPTPTPTPSPSPSPSGTPTPPITVTLPTANFSTSVPTSTNLIQPVVTTFIMEQPTTTEQNPEYPGCLDTDPECPPTIEVHHGIVGFQGDFTFKSNVVTFQSPYVQPAGLTANNWSFSASIVGTGTTRTLRMSGFSNTFTPLNGSGTLFELVMRRVSSSVGATSPLNWAASPDDCFLVDDNLNPITPNQINGLITIVAPTPTPTPLNISGTVVYCSNPSLNPVPGVTLTVTGNASGSTLSNGSGNYLFSSLASGGSYTVTPSMAALSPGAAGINTVDVVAVQRHFLAMTLLPVGCPRTAADVNGDTLVNTTDVIAIQGFFLARSTGIANTGTHQFSPTSRSYSPLTSNQTGQDYNALVLGDVVSGFVH